jgi:hypothetical protein
MRKLLKKQGFVPKLLVTDKLRSYASLASTLIVEFWPDPQCGLRRT